MRKVVILLLVLNSILGFALGEKWVNPMSKEQYSIFEKKVINYFKEKSIRLELNKEEGLIENLKSEKKLPEFFINSEISFQKLLQTCFIYPENEWENVIKDYFDKIQSLSNNKSELENMKKDYQKIKRVLAIRIYPENYLNDDLKKKCVYKNDFTGTISLLVYDLPEAVGSVSQEDFRSWGKAENEVFVEALDNVIEKYALKIYEKEYKYGSIFIINDNSGVFAPTAIYNIDDYEKIQGKYGMFVSIPNQIQVVICPINDKENLNEIFKTHLYITKGMYKEGPGSISDNVYWYEKSHRFSDVKNNWVNIEFPEELIKMLK